MKKKHKQNCGCIECRENVTLKWILFKLEFEAALMTKHERYMEWEKHNREYYDLNNIDSC